MALLEVVKETAYVGVATQVIVDTPAGDVAEAAILFQRRQPKRAA